MPLSIKVMATVLAFVSLAQQVRPDDSVRTAFEMRLAEDRPADGLIEAAFDGRKFYLRAEAVVTNKDIVDAHAEPGRIQGQFEVVLVFTPEGAEKLSQVTVENVGRVMVLMVNGEIVSAPIIQSRISANNAVISGNFNQETAERLAKGIKNK